MIRNTIYNFVNGSNCTFPNGSSTDCPLDCLMKANEMERQLHLCRNEYRFLDEVVHPLIRRRLRTIIESCERKRRVDSPMECLALANRSLNFLQNNCPKITDTTPCSPLCVNRLRLDLGQFERCFNFTYQTQNPFDNNLKQFFLRLRYVCRVSVVSVNILPSPLEDRVDVVTVNSFNIRRPRTRIVFDGKAGRIGFLLERYDDFADTTPSKRFRFFLRRIIEFTPRNNTNDTDFLDNGFDPDVSKGDTIEREHDFANITEHDVSPIENLGNLDIFGGPTTTDTGGAYRRAFRVVIRFGPLRLARAILTLIVSNVKSGFGDEQVILPGGFAFNLVLEDVPFTRDGTSFAVAFDFHLDKVDDTTIVRNKTGELERPDSPPDVSDSSESAVSFPDERRFRWRRRVYCDNNKDLVVRERMVTVVETPDGNFQFVRRVFITVHKDGDRCKRFFWDPTSDLSNTTQDDMFIFPPPNTGTTTPATDTNPSPTPTPTTTPATDTTPGPTPTPTPTPNPNPDPNPGSSGSSRTTLFASGLLSLLYFLM